MAVMAETEKKTEEQEKKDICERLCGEAGKRGIHVMAPEICPFLLDKWHKPERGRWA
jgi:hypothetical protein